ncbi:MAG TPA: sulfotransferase domain-containing protein [Rhizomicrobium sp.]|nr:sulfotransferase domain-containing protein [Rhizomicrobium sp.]
MQITLDHSAHEALFDLPDNDGAYSSAQLGYLSQLGARRPCVVLAFPPKAAGTFLRSAAALATGGEVLRLCYAQGSRDAQLYLPTLVAYYLGGFCQGPMVAHLHMQAFPPNTAMLEVLGIRPVIMVRSIADMLASYWDMLEISTAPNQGVNCTIPPDFRALDNARKADFLVDIVAPWYAGYYGTWLEYQSRNPDRVHMLDYADFMRQPAESLRGLLEHSGLPKSLAECQKAIDATWQERHGLRFNKGMEGRGSHYFAFPHLERISRLLSYYPATLPWRAELTGV